MSAEFEYAMQQKKNGNIDEAKLFFEKADKVVFVNA